MTILKPRKRQEECETEMIPSNAACTLRFKLCVAERVLAVVAAVAAALGGPPAEDGGLVPLMLLPCCCLSPVEKNALKVEDASIGQFPETFALFAYVVRTAAANQGRACESACGGSLVRVVVGHSSPPGPAARRLSGRCS